MTPGTPKRLRMFAGPNGSGKTSLVRKLAREFSPDGLFQLHQFINADDLFRDLQEGRGIFLSSLGRAVSAEQVRSALVAGGRLSPDHPFLEALQVVNLRLMAPAEVTDAYAAAAVADFLRDELLAAGQSFSFETVMSHRSKTEFFARARALCYRTYLYFIATESSHLNVYRVKNRTALGGHDVPETKIVERYERCLQLVGEALSHAYRAFLFDNSGPEPVWLAQLTPEGELQLKVSPDLLPAWFRSSVAPHYPGLIP
jgi:predicted ABC-type ATPase